MGQARRAAFTIVELLIVIAVIGILLAIILPSVGRARSFARELECVSNHRTLVQGFFSFAAENRGRLPGNWFDVSNADPNKRSWMRNQGAPLESCPQSGTLWKYVSNTRAYLCPTLENAPVNSRYGSNGRFDYASFQIFSGARLADLAKSEATFTYSDGRVLRGLPVPLIVEEEPDGGLNGGNLETGHSNTDRITHLHRGGGYIAAADGSVTWFLEPMDCNCWNWRAKTPSGVMRQLGDGTWYWGRWDSQ